MTKGDIIESVYEKLGGFSKKEVSELVDMVFEVMKDTLQDVVAQPAPDEVGALLGQCTGTQRQFLTGAVLACQDTLGQRRPHDLPDARGVADRDHLLLDHPPES